MTPFRARLEPVPHGGCYVPVPDRVATRAGLKTWDRVRGTVDGVSFGSTLAKYSGVFHLGVPKAALEEAKRKLGDTVSLKIERDDAPLAIPADLARALKKSGVRKNFEALTPAHQRMRVKSVVEAKKPETRERRIAAVVKQLH